MASRVRKATRKTKRTRKTTRNSGSKKLKSHFRRPTTAHQYFRLAPKDQETWDSVTHVVSRMRDGVSLPKASKEFDVAPSTVAELARSALRMRNGRYVPTKNDRLLRVLSV